MKKSISPTEDGGNPTSQSGSNQPSANPSQGPKVSEKALEHLGNACSKEFFAQNTTGAGGKFLVAKAVRI